MDLKKCIAAHEKLSEYLIKLVQNCTKAKKLRESSRLSYDIIGDVQLTIVFDKIFLEDSIEFEDIIRTERELNLKENEDYMRIKARFKERMTAL